MRVCTARSAAVLSSLVLTTAVHAVNVTPGGVPVSLQPVVSTVTGIPGVSTPPIDMHNPGDGNLYVGTIGGQVVRRTPDGGTNVFLNLATTPNVPFTSNFAGGLTGFAFHPDYNNAAKPGYRKLYTFSSDWKSPTQSTGGSIAPGGLMTGLPDFWSPEMYAPATSGNPLTNWTNPDSPSSGNIQFDHFNVIREWTADAAGNAVDAGVAPRVVLRMAHGYANKGSHNGGAMRFGPDGYLYFTTGDGGGNAGQDYDGSVNNGEDGHTDGTGNGQDKRVVYGKVLRIDPRPEASAASVLSANGQYRVPLTNPFRDGAGTNVDEIYAFGFRNPWKLNFDDRAGGTGALYLADVGQHHREEIDVITSGGNYGWGYMEGNVRLVSEDSATGAPDPSDLVDGTNGTPVRVPPGGWASFTSTAPLVDYLTRRQNVGGTLVGDGTASVGGFVYRGSALPELYGKYVFGDYSIAGTPPPGLTANKGRLFYIDVNNPAVINEFTIASGLAQLGELLGFGQDHTGELYAYFNNGNVVRLVGGNTWNANADGTWAAAANWTAAAPNAAGTLANFGRVITAPRTVTVDAARTVGSLNFDSENAYTLAGANAITLQNLSGSRVDVRQGSHTIGAPLRMANATTFNIEPAGATLSVSDLKATAATVDLTKTGLGTLAVNHVRVAALAIQAGIVRVAANGGEAGTSRLTSVVIPGAGTLDLADNALVIDYAGTSPLTSDVLPLIVAGRITSGTAGAGYSIGYAEASVLGLTSFRGQPIDGGDAVLLRVTRTGDANLDGGVTFDDLLSLAQHYGEAGTRTWTDGDFDRSGSVSFDDLLALAQNYGLPASQLPAIVGANFIADWALAQSLVAEPMSAFALMGLVAAAHRGRRERMGR